MYKILWLTLYQSSSKFTGNRSAPRETKLTKNESVKQTHCRVPFMAQQLTILTRIHEDAGSIPGLTQWVTHLALHELWCRPQTWLGSGVAGAVV